MNEKELRIRNSSLLYMISITIVMGSFYMGYSLVCISFLEQHIASANQVQTAGVYLAMATTALPMGALLGSLLYQKMVNAIGQCSSLILIDFLGIAACLLQVYSLQALFLITGRLLSGMVIGMSLGIIPSYLNSISPICMSGRICSFNQLFITVGIAVAYAMAFLLRGGSSNYWRLFLSIPAIGCVIRIVSLTFFFNFDNIQRHLQRKEIGKVKQYLNLVYYNATIQDFRKLKCGQKKEGESSLEVRNYSLSNYRKRLLVCVLLAVANQFCGINTIFFFAKQMFDKISSNDVYRSNILSLELGCLQVGLTLVSGMLIDKFGRRFLMLFGLSIIVTSLLLGFMFDSPKNIQFVQVAVFSHIIGFSFSLGPITMMYAAEVLDNLTAINALLWLQTIIIAMFSDFLISHMGIGKTFLLYALITGTCLVLLCFVMIETKGLTKNQIKDKFEDRQPLTQQQDQTLNLNQIT